MAHWGSGIGTYQARADDAVQARRLEDVAAGDVVDRQRHGCVCVSRARPATSGSVRAGACVASEGQGTIGRREAVDLEHDEEVWLIGEHELVLDPRDLSACAAVPPHDGALSLGVRQRRGGKGCGPPYASETSCAAVPLPVAASPWRFCILMTSLTHVRS